MKKILRIALVFGCFVLVGCSKKTGKEVDTIKIEEKTELEHVDLGKTFKKVKPVKLDETISSIKLPDDMIYTLLGKSKDTYYFVKEIDELSRIVSYDEEEKKWNDMGVENRSYDSFLMEVYGENVIVGNGYWDEKDNIHFQIVKFGNKGEKEVIFEDISDGFPTAQVIDNYLILDFSLPDKNTETCESVLNIINLDTLEKKEVFRGTYSYDENGYYKGIFTMGLGGWSKGFCFETVEMDNEDMLDKESGNCSMYYCDMENMKTEKLYDFVRKPFYMCGTEDCVITSAYALDSEDTGRITFKENGKYVSYMIPGIMPGEDLNGSLQLSDDVYLLCNGNKTMFYNIAEKTCFEIKNKKLLNKTRENIHWQLEGKEFFSDVQSGKYMNIYRYSLMR